MGRGCPPTRWAGPRRALTPPARRLHITTRPTPPHRHPLPPASPGTHRAWPARRSAAPDPRRQRSSSQPSTASPRRRRPPFPEPTRPPLTPCLLPGVTTSLLRQQRPRLPSPGQPLARCAGGRLTAPAPHPMAPLSDNRRILSSPPFPPLPRTTTAAANPSPLPCNRASASRRPRLLVPHTGKASRLSVGEAPPEHARALTVVSTSVRSRAPPAPGGGSPLSGTPPPAPAPGPYTHHHIPRSPCTPHTHSHTSTASHPRGNPPALRLHPQCPPAPVGPTVTTSPHQLRKSRNLHTNLRLGNGQARRALAPASHRRRRRHARGWTPSINRAAPLRLRLVPCLRLSSWPPTPLHHTTADIHGEGHG